MASQAPANSLPLFYKDLMPISSQEHATFKLKAVDHISFAKTDHAIPVTIDEFAVVQRYYPIVFSLGAEGVPLALMGLNEGVNTFIDDEGKLPQDVYVPAYIRRYPFMLARLREDADEMSLCVDPTADALGKDGDGPAVFNGDAPSDEIKAILEFCEQFEQAGQRTAAFMAELRDNDLLMDGEVSIQTTPDAPPYVYRGFQMVNEEKLRDLRGDVLRKMMQSGLLPLVHAHLFSLQAMREIFARQVAQGKLPAGEPVAA